MAECGTYTKYAIGKCRCEPCILAGKTYNANYNRENRDKIKAYRETNKERISARKKFYREKNKAHIDEYKKVYYEKNKAHISEKFKSNYWVNLERNKQRRKRYYHDNRNHWLMLAKHNINLTYGITDLEYEQILNYQNDSCATCKVSSTIKPLLRDHYHEDGYQKRSKKRHNFRGLLCRSCNTFLGHLETYNLLFGVFLEYVNNPPAKKVLK